MPPKQYRGPSAEFPYETYRALGAVQLTLGLCIVILGLVHATLSYDDRKILLLSGSAVIWCPLMPIAAGIIGILICKKRYWEVECLVGNEALIVPGLNTAFIIVSSFAAAFMIGLILVTIFLEFYYYGVLDLEPEEMFDYTVRRFTGEEEEGYTAMISLVLVFAALELIFSVASSLVGCCCSPIYEPDRGQHFQVIKKPLPLEETQQPRFQIPVQAAPAQFQQAQPMVTESQLQPVQLVYQEQPAPVQFGNPTPSLIYMPAPSTLTRY